MRHVALCLLLLFTVTVKIPWGVKKTYTGVRSIVLHESGFVYTLYLSGGTVAYVPTQWTVIEEIK